MPLNGMDVVEILRIGVTGLGFLLAVLSYHLLTKEQAQEHPRAAIIRAIYAFMSFSIVLCILGGVSQATGSFAKPILTTKVTAAHEESGGTQSNNGIADELASSKKIIGKLKEELMSKEAEILRLQEQQYHSISKLVSDHDAEIMSFKLEVGGLQDQVDKCNNDMESSAQAFKKKLEMAQASCLVEQKPVFPTDPFYVERNETIRLAGGQVLLFYEFRTSSLVLTLGADQTVFELERLGQRFDFIYNRKTYFIDVLTSTTYTNLYIHIIEAR